jgi:uncharacterized membrane protein YfcA
MDISIETLVFLTFIGFIAGFVDSIVGGGGLIMVPSMMISLPSLSVAQVMGTVKIPSIVGICMAAYQYTRKIKVKAGIIMACCLVAFASAYVGSWLVIQVSNDFMKPFLLVVLVAVAVYTFVRKDFGQHVEKSHTEKQQLGFGCLVSLLVGFYDGFIGPGGGSFFMLGFVLLLGFNFLQATAYAKLANAATNAASLILFVSQDKVIWPLGLTMAIGTLVGSLIGSRYAMSKGNAFIRKFFLIVVTLILIRFAYDVFFK